MRALWPFARRSLLGRRGRTALLVAAVALAASLVVAVTSGMRTAQASLDAAVARAMGATDARVVHRYAAPFDAALLDEIRAWPGVARAAGRLNASITLSHEGAVDEAGKQRRSTVQCRGVDPAEDAFFREVEIEAGRRIERAGEVVLDPKTATALAAKPGDTLRIEAPGSIELLDEDARIHLNTSRLETTGEATISGSGALEVTGFSTVSIENGHLALRGIDSAASLLRLAPESGLGVFGPGTWSVAQAQLRLSTGSQLALHTSTELDTVQLAAPEWTAFLRSHARLRLQAVHSRGIATYHEHPSGASFRASQSSWETAPLELAASGFRFSSCTFMSSPVVATGSGFPSRVENSAFGGPTPAVEALFRISDCSGPTTFEACTFQDAVLGLDASHAELRIRCSTFAGLDTALSAGIGGMIDLGAQAHNQFADNRNHIAFSDAPVPDLAHGENAFGMWSESLFAGTWDTACVAGCQLIAPGNAWPWSSPGTPYLLGLQGMHCTGCPAGMAQLSDPAPVLPRTCTADGDRPITEAGDTRPRSSEDEAATGLRIVPNPSRGLARLIPPPEWGTSM